MDQNSGNSDQKHREFWIGEHKVLVDSEDYAFLSRFSWSINKNRKTYYAKTNVKIGNKTTAITMHRLITGLVTSQIDHKNRNGLDNRKENLRFATKSQNSTNRIRENKFGYRGVYQPKNSHNYSFQIQINGKRVHKHGYATAEMAARAYDKMSEEHHGEFGIRNFEE